MKQRVNLSLTENLYKFVRRNHKNLSFYVEKLIVRDLTENLTQANSGARKVLSENPSARSFLNNFIDEKFEKSA